MKASPILLQKKYARVVEAFAKEMGMTLNEALGVFYHSELYRLVSEGVSDMHCMSDAYLAEELAMEYKGIGEYAEKDCAVKGKTEKYLAHKEGEREQSLSEHLVGTAKLAKQFAESFGKGDWGYCCGMLHDIGKYSQAFQEKIRSDPNKKVDHATAGMKVCLEKGGWYSLMSYCIAGHHAGLPDRGCSSDSGSAPTLVGRNRKKIEDFQAYKEEIQIPEIQSMPLDSVKKSDQDFSFSVFIRMLYSCLVDADFLDTENFMNAGQIKRDAGERPEKLLEKLKNYVADWLANENLETVDGRRTEILKHCLECGQMERGVFQLTVPTGGGKTIASLAFALQHAVKNHMDRVIYVIPYTSIIEQNAEVFREILGEQNVLENHYNVDYESSEELKPMQLAAENWDKPVVVTTNVQFFESLYANRSSKCRKLHNIANSVIIFDEAQMLPLDYLKPCVAVMEELVVHFASSIVLCTATQPVLTPYFRNEILVTELCPRVQEQFQFFERVTFQNISKISEEELIGRLEQETQALCIVNTKKRAQKLYQKIKGEGVFHLSTTMYPAHRRRVLDQIKRRLKNEEKCILVSTSLVEAGVDLDFHAVYRQLAGVDSIMQAAGRCNRERKRAKDESIAYIFQFEEKENVPGQQLFIDISKRLLSNGGDIPSLQVIEKYFGALYRHRGDSLDKKKIMDEFRNYNYNFSTVSQKFKLIEENTKTIFIGKEDKAKELLQQLQDRGYSKEGIRKAGQYCVQLYENDVEILQGAGMLKPISEDIEEFYELTDEKQYTEEMGLNLGIESGMAVLM